MHQCQEEQLSFQLVFADTLDALRFCIVTQVALLYEEWPKDSLSSLGGTVAGLDNKLLFKGPRMALALVTSSEYTYVWRGTGETCTVCFFASAQLVVVLLFPVNSASPCIAMHPHQHREVRLPSSEVSVASNVHWVDCTYHGPGPALAQALVSISNGGQTVCNEVAWKALQDNLPGRCQVGGPWNMTTFVFG